VSITNGIGQ